MTESEWFDSDNPHLMIRFLDGRTTDRKLRLFACACAASNVHAMGSESFRCFVRAAEDYADGLIDIHELLSAAAAEGSDGDVREYIEDPLQGAIDEADLLADVAYHLGTSPEEMRSLECQLLRDIAGNPFRPAVAHSSWLTWSNGIVVELATGIYKERAFDRLPILGDALVEAGCQDEDVIAHCYSSSPHVCGCWVVDTILRRA